MDVEERVVVNTVVAAEGNDRCWRCRAAILSLYTQKQMVGEGVALRRVIGPVYPYGTVLAPAQPA